MLLAEAEGDKATYHRPRIRKGAGIVYCIEIGSTPSVADRTASRTP